MATKTKTSGDDKVTTTDTEAVEAKASTGKTVTGAEYDKVVKSFYEGRLLAGYNVNFVTSGGTTKPVVTKRG